MKPVHAKDAARPAPALKTVPLPDFRLWPRARAGRVPLSFELELTARCNCDCRHCYLCLPAADRAAQDRELTSAEIAALAEQAADLGALWVLLTGGEPLLRPDFAEIYLGLKRRGLLVTVFTNACLVDKGIAALFGKYPPRDIELTVYGADRRTYEAVTRTPGSFEQFKRGLRLLEQAGVKPRLKAMALRTNYGSMERIAAFCRRHTRDRFRFDPQLHLRYDRDEARNKLIREERLSAGEVVALERADAEHFQAMQRQCDTLVATGSRKNLFFCRAGLDSFTIGWDGRFKLCGSLTAPQCTCDLRDVPLRQAWAKFAPAVRKIKASAEHPGKCASCTLVNLCLWCPAHAWLETGHLDRPVEGFCRTATARRTLLP